ncbi:MAG: hypothetical protein V3W09_04675 [Nitrososphaerales archaeon]
MNLPLKERLAKNDLSDKRKPYGRMPRASGALTQSHHNGIQAALINFGQQTDDAVRNQ